MKYELNQHLLVLSNFLEPVLDSHFRYQFWDTKQSFYHRNDEMADKAVLHRMALAD